MSTFSSRTAASANDGYKDPNFSPAWDYTGTSLVMGVNTFPTRSLTTCIRFDNVTIPAGSTINSAVLNFTANYTDSNTVKTTIKGFDEDNTATLTSDPTGRATTGSIADWTRGGVSNGSNYDTPDITTIIQEIVDRGGWASGNAMGFLFDVFDTNNDNLHWYYSYDSDSTKAPLLTIDYTPPPSTFSEQKAGDFAVKSSHSTTKFGRYVITDAEDTPVPFVGIKIAKSGHNVMNTKNPNNLKFSSEYNTLKYYTNSSAQIHVTAAGYDFYTIGGYIEHNLGYYPVAMVYAKDDILNKYVPVGYSLYGSGAYRIYSFYVTTTRLYFYVDGYSESGVDYYVDFYYKIFRNKITVA